ncbi:YslB family protein [Leuconostoc lactis]|uniref:YslB family protein n=1 Tax=Leuconostoc lactis TaxID=1246 RepID=UPI0025B21319|nr:YslB family protein [Leuconostoc lactis]MDN2649335.1 YslB family protein [Leuconostoc lactis]
MNINDYDKILQTNFQVNSFALTLLRDGLLQNLLQEDYPHILYWAGKEIARQFPFDALASVVEFFDNAGFGHLEIASQDSKNQRWTLTGDLVQQRLNLNRSADFSLEAGFLAQQLELQTGAIAEATFKIGKKNIGVNFEVVTDLNETVDVSDIKQRVAARESFLKQTHETVEQAQLIEIRDDGAISREQSITDSLLAFKFDDIVLPIEEQNNLSALSDDEAIDPFNVPTTTFNDSQSPFS